MYKITHLDNGLRIVSYKMPHMKSVATGVWIGVGGRYETENLSGISHLLEHLLFKGTTVRSGKEIRELIEGMGGTLNGFTSEEFTCYLVKIQDEHLGLCLDVLSDMALNAKLSPDDIKKEKLVILEEIRMYQDLPSHYVTEFLNQLLWPGQPLGRDLIGTPKTVSAIGLKDLSAYKDKFYAPPNITMVVAGNINEPLLIEKCRKYFAKVSRKPKLEFAAACLDNSGPKTKFHFKETEQTHLALGLHAPSRNHPQRYVLSLLHIILGANMSSRLFQEVREKRGLAYEIRTYVKRLKDTGAFIITAGVDNKKAPQATQVILEELLKIKNKSVSKDELKRAKEFYKGQLLLALEDTLDHMLFLGENVMSRGKIESPSMILEKINKITADDIKHMAKNIFKNKSLFLALIGPLKDKETLKIKKKLEIL